MKDAVKLKLAEVGLGVVLVVLLGVGVHQFMRLYANEGGVGVGFVVFFFGMLCLLIVPLLCHSPKTNSRGSSGGDAGGLDFGGDCSDGGGGD